MILTDKDTNVVLGVSYIVFDFDNGVKFYRVGNYIYMPENTILYDESADVIPQKNTYIDGVIGINPDYHEPYKKPQYTETELSIFSTQLNTEYLVALAELGV